MRQRWRASPWLFRSIACVVSVAMMSGCTSISVQPQVPLDGEKAQAVLQALREREANIKAIKGLFQASITGSVLPISQNLNGVLFYHRPTDVHLRGFTRVGGVIFEFLRENDSYELRLPSAGKIRERTSHGAEQKKKKNSVRLSS